MPSTKRALVGAVVAATAALMTLSAVPAQASDGKVPVKPGARVDASLSPDRAAKAKVAASAATTAELAALQGRIARYAAANKGKYTFGSYIDANTGRIVVDTNAPDTVLASLTNLSGATLAAREAAGTLKVNRSAVRDSFSRRDDVPAYYGGGGITSGGGICSSGYAVRNGAGTVFMMTAGHCFATGATVLTESRARVYGTVSNRHLPTVTGEAYDAELIGGSSYAGRIFTGGVNSSTSTRVVAAGPAYVGYNAYCQSGRTTGETCGHTATSVNGQVCTQTGCKSPVIVYTGGVIGQPGDSGSPFYAKDTSGNAWIRGHFIAASSTTGYVEPYTVVSSRMGVSVVTS
ncbi:hypothetical protein EV385_3197 [Krasilnikovia cinnamomea]|uniref:Streptogrisin C n=1 Tax=Krasilnikovia cinnamomea TaxID=349313 RepID=A0A4Q7ZKC0_9ACTN|nr:hypothetical protein [Krasilnikovia cinnamomea]RZU51370.1 hypothetical protein EV385_3197 [Krasilnikovia cinnamomea]